MNLSGLKPPAGQKKSRKRIGRGMGSGHGKTSTRGRKGQHAGTGFSQKRGFEGGQMPLHRRLPKRGFTNIFKKQFAIVNLGRLEKLEGDSFNVDRLIELGVIKKLGDGLKVLGTGELTRKITVEAHQFSKSALEKIQKAGGTAQVIGAAGGIAPGIEGNHGKVFEAFANIFRVPDLRKRLLFTLAMLAVYRLGGHIPTPGINIQRWEQFFGSQAGSIFGFFDLFAGGNIRRLTIFALGIMPYITASIILQLLTVVVPTLEKLQKEGELGRRKITQWTRYLTIILSVLQSFGIAQGLMSMRAGHRHQPGLRVRAADDAVADHRVRPSSCGWASRSASAASATACR